MSTTFVDDVKTAELQTSRQGRNPHAENEKKK
jgi:hypothetical protein